MNEDFVSFEQAVKLYNLDFDWDCERAYYIHSWMKGPRLVLFSIAHKEQCNYDGTDVYPAPSLAQAQKWLREAKGIAINVLAHDGGKYDYDIVFLPNAVECDDILNRSPWCRTYEEALSEGITAALELIDKKGE